MPTYEYVCDDCGYRFERSGKSYSDSSKPDRCPKCGERASRVYSSDVVIVI